MHSLQRKDRRRKCEEWLDATVAWCVCLWCCSSRESLECRRLSRCQKWHRTSTNINKSGHRKHQYSRSKLDQQHLTRANVASLYTSRETSMLQMLHSRKTLYTNRTWHAMWLTLWFLLSIQFCPTTVIDIFEKLQLCCIGDKASVKTFASSMSCNRKIHRQMIVWPVCVTSAKNQNYQYKLQCEL